MEKTVTKDRQNKPAGRKVLVAMSGGVDSAVAAAILKQDGFMAVGAFARGWEPEGYPCSWREERRDAMRVAARLGMPLLTFDLSTDYERLVVDPMLADYRRGRTPNPDILCNREIKFGLLLKAAQERGFDYLATGHYVRLQPQSKIKTADGFRLAVANDHTKDQSYFLWTLTQDILTHCLFPIGKYKKSQVRQLAKQFKLPVAEKKDSQGVCFVGPLDFKQFLRERLQPVPGPVINERGEVIGEHQGAVLYTLGERHGFTINNHNAKSAAHYVVAKDLTRNALTVSSVPRAAEEVRGAVNLESVNWIAGTPPQLGREYHARLRYRQELAPGHLRQVAAGWQFVFNKPLLAAPGQSCVIYQGNTLLGGGVIAK